MLRLIIFFFECNFHFFSIKFDDLFSEISELPPVENNLEQANLQRTPQDESGTPTFASPIPEGNFIKSTLYPVRNTLVENLN